MPKGRFRFPEIFFGMLLAVAIFATGLIFGLSRNFGPATKSPGAGHRGDEKNNSQQDAGLWNWLTRDASGFFTIWLVVIGGAQLVLFYVQLRLIRESLDDAKIAADAGAVAANAATKQAEAAERALTELERPWIFVDLSRDLHGSPDNEFQDPYALFDIVNHGRGPAIIDEFHGEISSDELRPGSPLLRDEFHGIIGPGKAMEKCEIECPRGFKYDLTVSLVDDTQSPIPKPAQEGWEVFLRIVIHYHDIARGMHVSGFCWRYDHGVLRWVKFEEQPGGNEYNYLT